MKNSITVFTTLLAVATVLLLGACHRHTSATHTHESGSAAGQSGDYFGSNKLVDEKYGTNTIVTVKGEKRTMVTNSLPNAGRALTCDAAAPKQVYAHVQNPATLWRPFFRTAERGHYRSI